MEQHDKAKRRRSKEALRSRFSGLALPRERSPREEVIEILAEGLWTLICQGRGPAAGKFQALRDDLQKHTSQEDGDTCENSSNA